MDHTLLKDRLPRVMLLLACGSVGWLAYKRYIRKRDSFYLTKADDAPKYAVLPAQPSLENLSLDVLLEIMIYLEWHELLKLRQVSSRLKLATYQRALWYNLMRSSPSRYTLHKRVQVCSSQDLEDTFLRVQKANRRWVNPQTPQRVEKVLGLGEISWYDHQLLPGGRWLLKLEPSAELRYTDLDSPIRVWHSLIPPSFENNESRPWFPLPPLLDHDIHAETHTFTLATITPAEEPGPSGLKFVIWRCSSDFDDYGHEIGWKAFKLSTFVEHGLNIYPKKLCLRGDFIAYINGNDDRPVVVDWHLANGYTGNPPRYCFANQYPDALDLHLLPASQQILCRGYVEWHILSWNTLSPTRIPQFDPLTEDDGISAAVDPVPFFNDGGGLSLEGNLASFVAYVPKAFSRIFFQIPNPGAPSPFTMKVDPIYEVDPNVMSRCLFTANRILVILKSTGVTTGAYFMDEDRNARHIKFFCWGKILPFVSAGHMMLDDVSGRFLILDDSTELNCYVVQL